MLYYVLLIICRVYTKYDKSVVYITQLSKICSACETP